MKKNYAIWTLLAFCLMAACSEDPLDGLTGKYDLDRYVWKSLAQQPTEKRGRGIKAIIMKVTEKTDTFQIDFGSSEWTLPAGTYSPTDTVLAAKVYAAKWIGERKPDTLVVKEKDPVSGDTVKRDSVIFSCDTVRVISGTVDVQLTGDTYFFNGLLTDENGRSFMVDYKGTLSFEIGEDDPEPSGYTATLTPQPVYQTDATGQVTGVVAGVLQYTFAVSDPDGQTAASFDLINADNIGTAGLAGSYEIQSSATGQWQMGAGWALPAAWGGWSGGSYVVQDGAKQFLTAGTVSIAADEAADGTLLFSFSGSGLTSTLGMDETGANTPGTATDVNIKFVTVE